MKPFFIAISMYSRLPAPQFPWEEKDRRRAICFFPCVGFFVGAAFLLAFWLLERMGANALLKGGVLAAVPLLVTGGIHMDGFLDTCDARASWGDREKKLEILKDSHTGAFAVISGVLYLLLLAGVYSMLTWEEAKPAAAGFILSRAFSGLSVALLPNARGSGMLSELTKTAARKKRRRPWLSGSCFQERQPFGGILQAACFCFFFRYYLDFFLPHGEKRIRRDYRRSGGIFSGTLRAYAFGWAPSFRPAFVVSCGPCPVRIHP